MAVSRCDGRLNDSTTSKSRARRRIRGIARPSRPTSPRAGAAPARRSVPTRRSPVHRELDGQVRQAAALPALARAVPTAGRRGSARRRARRAGRRGPSAAAGRPTRSTAGRPPGPTTTDPRHGSTDRPLTALDELRRASDDAIRRRTIGPEPRGTGCRPRPGRGSTAITAGRRSAGRRGGHERGRATGECGSLYTTMQGHPFQVQLSRELAARGHDVLHLYCSSVTDRTRRGRAEAGRSGDLRRRAHRSGRAPSRSTHRSRGSARSAATGASWPTRSRESPPRGRAVEQHAAARPAIIQQRRVRRSAPASCSGNRTSSPSPLDELRPGQGAAARRRARARARAHRAHHARAAAITSS